MSASELPHDPVELSDELDDIIRAQEMLRQRTIALQARYQALQSLADEGRYDKPGKYEYSSPEEFGSVNVNSTATRLGYVHETYMDAPLSFLRAARESAVKVREYPRPEREQDELSATDQAVEDSGPAWNASTSALAGYASTDNALADAVARNADREGRSL
ncbi:hypothetical protein [Nocardia xishanensis]|uniref:hypothetical protein n=1 Tax=Nocardia xishanensis TaxID=238964 RepID=UPI00082DFFF1|nr:hypothetical protein [Nocardia xishanensis]